MAVATSIERKSFDLPDETRPIPNGKIDVVIVGGRQVARGTFNPGWHWMDSMRELMQTPSCPLPHFGYVISGSMHIQGDDGSSADVSEGEAISIPPGHDAWVLGSVPCVVFDISAAEAWGKQR